MPFRDRPRLLKLTFETLEPLISGHPEVVPKTYRLCNSERHLPQKASGGSQPKANLGLLATLTMRPAGRVQSHFCGTSAQAILKNLGAARPPGCAVNQNRRKTTRNASHRKSSLPNQTTRRLEGRIHCKGRVAIASISKLGASKTRIAVLTLPPMLGMMRNTRGITMSSETS
jgi:hypothetical protein